MLTIDHTLKDKKEELLNHFRSRALESLEEICRIYGISQFRERAQAVNKAVTETKNTLIKTLTQKAGWEGWDKEDILRCVLMITYVSYVVMIETRNEVWPYDYMAFSRRVGELWEPFCKLCFENPLSGAMLFIPPLFSEVKQKLTREIDDYIDQLNIKVEQKDELKKYYGKVWSLVTSGEIQLELDLHFQLNNEKYVVDFKSGFGSNEKGNTNRLLLVATIYKSLEENYNCLLLVRAEEDRNNAYFQTLKNSGIWKAYCGGEAYAKIKEFSGFDIKEWIKNNVNWPADLLSETRQHLGKNNLDQYLVW
ncbi:MAG TPA: hypothetical protein VFB60_06845 [Ktedonobacteraceae bacterium]|nr:hypothetical protein [Ktedonobacteraceae bacterium]